MVIQHNIPALNAHRNMGLNNSGINKNLEKLSSGFRINRAADDAAGLAISEKMRGQIKGLAMAEQNTSHGINLIQTAEGGLNETHSILQRMRELAVQASNGTYQEDDLQQLTLEFEALKSEIDRIAESTHYNGIKLLNGRLDDTLYTQRMQDANDILKNATFGVNASAGDEFLIEVSANAVTAASVQVVPQTAALEFDISDLDITTINGTDDKLVVNLGGGVTANYLLQTTDDHNAIAAGLAAAINTAAGANATYTATSDGSKVIITANEGGAAKGADVAGIGTGAITVDGSSTNIDWNTAAPIGARTEGLDADSFSSFDIKFEDITVASGKDIEFKIGGVDFKFTTTAAVTDAAGLAAQINAYFNDTAQDAVAKLAALGVEVSYTAASDTISFKALEAGSNSAVDALTLTDLTYNTTPAGVGEIPSKNNAVTGVTLRTQTVPPSVDLDEITVDNQAIKNAVHDTKTNTVRFEDQQGNQFTIDYNRLKAGEAMSAQVRAAEGDNLVFQIGANGGSDQRVYLAVTDMSSFTLGLYEGDIKSNGIEATADEALLLARANITTIADANIAIDVITAATNQVSSQRAELGALQNRLESAMNSLGITKENLTAAESTIRDVDMAKEMMDFTKNSILVQASQAMLAQANQLPQGVLQLLR